MFNFFNLFSKKNKYKKTEPKIIDKDEDFLMFTSEEGMTEEESLQFIYDNLLKNKGNN